MSEWSGVAEAASSVDTPCPRSRHLPAPLSNNSHANEVHFMGATLEGTLFLFFLRGLFKLSPV